MHSIRQAACEVGKPEYWVRNWVRKLKLGEKVGWAIVLGDTDLYQLKEKASNHGHQKAA